MRIKKMRNNLLRLAILIFLCMTVSLISNRDVFAATEEEAQVLSKMKLVAETNALELYFNETDTDIAVRVKESGDIWFSNPVGADTDEQASAYYQRLMNAQLSVIYYNEKVQKSEMDNYNDSILDGQFEVEYLSDGVTVTYTLGEMKSKQILPMVISEERYESYFNQMDESAQKKVKRNYTHLVYEELKEDAKANYLALYPNLETMNLYVLKTGTKDYLIEELMGYFTQVGYTEEDMYADMEAAGYVSDESKAWFVVPLTYRLEGESLVIAVDPKQITYNEDGFYLAYVNLLPYFGAADTKETGYMLVPDGSGALIHLNNGKKDSSSYYAQVYGTDLTSRYTYETVSEADENLSVKLPVFGLKTEDSAWFAIIEDGAGYANLNADISGKTTSYNNVYAGFSYLDYGPISLSDVIGSNGFQMYSKPMFEGEYELRIAFLHGEDANYSGMARLYQNYLIDQGILKKQKVKEDLPFYVDYIGAMDKLKSFFGFKYHSVQALTTYQQAANITSLLMRGGVDNVVVSYSGWMNGGLNGTAPTKVREVSKLSKGGMSLDEFMSQMSEWGMKVFHKVDFQYVYKDQLFDGYNANTYNARYFDNKLIKFGRALIPNRTIVEKTIQMLSPSFVNTIISKFIRNADQYNLDGINVGSMSTVLYSDYNKKAYSDRQAALRSYVQGLETLEQTYENGIYAENANDYTFAYTSDIVNVPFYSNSYRILDEDVPFYELVIRGYIEFAGESLNLSQDYETTLLKSVETGAGLYFQWMYEDNSVLKNTDYDYLYSVNYESWLTQAIQDYTRVNEIFEKLQGQTIKSHEKLQENVYLVTYESGTQIAVNYNEYSVMINQTVVNAKDFAVIKEG